MPKTSLSNCKILFSEERKKRKEEIDKLNLKTVETTRHRCSDSWPCPEGKRFSTCLPLLYVHVMFAYVCICEEAGALGERGVFFFHPEGPHAGVGRGGALGRHSVGRAVSAEPSALVTALGAGGHWVQHSSRSLSVYTTAAGPGGGGSAA